MKKFLLSLMAIVATSASAQFLVKDRVWTVFEYGEDYYDCEPSQIFSDRFGVHLYENVQDPWLGELRFGQEGLAKPESLKDFTPVRCVGNGRDNGHLVIFEKKDFYDNTDAVLVIYDKNKKVTRQVDLYNYIHSGHVSNIYSEGDLYYLSMDDNIFCFDAEQSSVVWRTCGQATNGEFILTDKYIVSGFGGSEMDDFVRLFDRKTGNLVTSAPIASQAMTFEATQSGDSIYVCDYNNKLYRFIIKDKALAVTGKGVRLRQGPSTNDALHTDYDKKTVFVSTGDMLNYIGTEGDWNKVYFDEQTLYISANYTKLQENDVIPQDMLLQWMDQGNYHPFYPVVCKKIDLDNDGINEYVIKDESGMVGIFTYKDKKAGLVCSGDAFQMQYNDKDGLIHKSVQVSNGYEEEINCYIKGSTLWETYTHESIPQGNIHEQSEVGIKEVYTMRKGYEEPKPISQKLFESKIRDGYRLFEVFNIFE